MLELIAVDGRDVEPAGALSVPHQEDETARQLRALLQGQKQMMSVLIAQQAQIERLNQALLTVRVSRAQERALRSAITARAKELAAAEGLRGAERRIGAAIRTTLRETTGAQAVGDLPATHFERALQMVATWHMAGALRRIRREVEKA